MACHGVNLTSIYSFNLPFNLKTKTKISKLFLNRLDKHFSPHKKLQRLFNRTNVKIKERCMSYMNFYTYMHNDKVLNDKPNETRINNCNCSKKDTWSLPNSYQTKCIIYQANIDCDITGQKCYLGSCETTFNPHTHKMGPRGSKHCIFGYQFYSKNARMLRFHKFLHFHVRKYMISFYLKWTEFTRSFECCSNLVWIPEDQQLEQISQILGNSVQFR